MLANPDFNNKSIDNYKRKILQTFMSPFCLFRKKSLTLLYLEVIANVYIISSG